MKNTLISCPRFKMNCLLIFTIAAIGCSKNTVTTSSYSGGSLGNLPKVTGSVSSSVSSKIESLSAATGIKLKDVDDSSNWTTGKSRPLCELSFMTREILRDASTPDRTLCYVGKMQQLGKFTGTIDDSTYKYYTLTAEGTPMLRVKFKITKDSTGGIANYEMFTCQYSSGTYSHTEYLSETISNGSATISAKNLGSQGSISWGSSTSVTGTINSSGVWTGKTIESLRHFSANGNSFDGRMTLIQGSNYMTISGDNRMDTTGTSNDFAMTLYGKVEILNPSSLQTLAFGDGSAKATMTYGGSTIGSAGQTAHWTGDDRATAGTSGYASDVASASLRTDGGTASVSFSSQETWDCTAGSSSFGTAEITQSDMSSLQSCDSTYGFGSDESGGGYACSGIP